MSNFRSQLTELGLVGRMDEFLEEAGRVREDMGYPIMVTPFSQFVGVQATFNVMQKERYKTVPKELARYVMGYYGDSPAPINIDVIDKISEQVKMVPEKSKDVFNRKILKKFRQEAGLGIPDEELLLRLFYGSPIVESMMEEKQAISEMPSVKSPLHVLLEQIRMDKNIESFFIEKGDFKMSITRKSNEVGAQNA